MAVFVGRQRELTDLGTRLERALAGQPGVCLISGEPGIGKTRLATELATAAEEQGFLVRWGRCWDGPGAPALWPWTQALEAGEWLPPGGTERLESDDDSFVVYEATAGRLRTLGTEQPLVVVLDDLHWADPLSLRVLRFVAQHLQRVPALVVGTYREHEARLDPSQVAVFEQLSRYASTLALRGLSTAEITDLVDSSYGVRLAPAAARRLQESTAGNPFFLDEVMRLLLAEGSDEALEAFDTFDARRVPDGVRDATRRRLALLPPETADVLAAAAVVGPQLEPAVLGVVTGLERAEVVARLDAARAAGLVAPDGTAYRFTHALVRETMYGDLDSSRRADLHRRTGDALERFYAAGLAEHAAELAHHLAEAHGPAEARRAAEYDLAAGADATGRFAYEQAAAHARHGLAALRAMADPDLRTRANLHLLEAEAHLRLSNADGLKEAATRAAADAREVGSNEHLARAAIAYGSMATAWAADPDGVDLCESALDAVGATRPDLRARLLCSLAWMHVTAGDLDSADRPSERGLELARQLENHQTLCRALYVRHEVFYGTQQASTQLALAEELVGVAERNNDAYWRAQGHRSRALPRLILGDAAGFADDAEATARLGATLRSRVHTSLGHSWRGVLALLAGGFEEVEAHTNAALAVLPGDPDAVKAYASQLFWLRHEQGRLAELRPLIGLAFEQEPNLPAVRAVAGHLHAELGDHEEAGRHLDALCERGVHQINRDWGWSLTMTSMASMLALVRPETSAARQAAEALVDLLAPGRGQLVVVAAATHCAGAFDRYRGMLLDLLERWDEAESAFTDARRLEERAGAVPLAARTRYWHARMLAERDPTRAAALLDESLETASSLGMARLVEEAERLSTCI
jgi:hypothetical protein